MEGGTRTNAVEQVSEGEVLHDTRADEYYVLVAISSDGITIQRQDREYYIPHSIFAEWYDPDRIGQDEAGEADHPAWVE